MDLRWTCLILVVTATLIESRAIDDFLRRFAELNMKPAYRPVEELSSALNLTVSYAFTNVENINGANGIATLRGWISLGWTDSNIHWDLNEFPVNAHRVSPKELWTPDIKVFNALEENVEETLAVVRHDGSISLINPVTYDGFLVNLEGPGLDLSLMEESPRWELVEHSSEFETTYYECCTEPYQKLTMELTFERKDIM